MGKSSSAGRPTLFGAIGVLGFLVLLLSVLGDALLPRYYFLQQDRLAALGIVGALGLVAWLSPGARLPSMPPPRLFVALSAFFLAVLLWGGTYWLMLDYPITRDELMARFDAEVFASGRLLQPVPEEWRPFTQALVPQFLVPVPGWEGWISNYMPGHAMMRAGFGGLADPALLNPLLTGVGLVALADVARRLFPQEAGAQWMVLIGYVVSAQVLATAMTSYAMAPHLASSCLWLALFLRDRWWSHGLAMLLGVVSIGLHQIVFHPIFAGPILLTLLARRRWGLFAIYAAIYAAALFWWIGYHGWIMERAGIAGNIAASGGIGHFLTARVLPLLTEFDSYTLPLMLYNLLRFAVWMPLFLLPLLLLSKPSVMRNEGLALPLAAGVLLVLIALAWLMPYQGHGWGYRYLHGFIPSVLLLAGYGYVRWASEDRSRADGAVAWLAVATVPVLILLAITTRQFVEPYAALSERIERQAVDFVVIDTDNPGSAIDQVRNKADLSNRPLVFSAEFLDAAMMRELCARGTVTLLAKDAVDLPQFGQPRDLNPDAAANRQWISEQACFREPDLGGL